VKFTVAKKLYGGFLLVLALLALLAGISVYQITKVDESYNSLIEDRVQKLILVKNIEISQKEQSSAVRGYLLTGYSSHFEDYTNSLEDYNTLVKKLSNISHTPESRKLIQELENTSDQYHKVVEQQFTYKRQKNEEAYLDIMNSTAKELSAELSAKADKLTKYQEKQLASGSAVSSANSSKIKMTVSIISLIAVVIGLALAYAIGRLISRPIVKAAQVLNQVAGGNLATEMPRVKNRDEIGDLAISLNKMVGDLRTVVARVRDSSIQVAAGSEELAASAEQSTSAAEQIAHITQTNAKGTERQLKDFQEVSVSVEEMASGIQQIASSSEKMLYAAEEATEVSNLGTRSVEKVVRQMNMIDQSVGNATVLIQSLEEKSHEISNIVSIITGIADQTNLLALNAAIEAARAGELGKGFSVVADEVRKLAEESKASADQIKQMIGMIQLETKQAVKAMQQGNKQVAGGLEETKEANDAFVRISDSIQEVSGRVQEMSAAVQEMTAFSKEISVSIVHVKEISEESFLSTQESSATTQQQLATMEEVSSSAESLSKLAEELQTTMNRFTL
jgi:methyl-accepting chemotaxis protein